MTNLNIKSLKDIDQVAQKLIETLHLNMNKPETNCLAFYGEMGAGKTTLIKAICKELGVREITSSPTFAIVNEYVDKNSSPIFHFDFYRLNSESEAFDFGYEEYFYSGHLCLIEWPEKIEKLLPVSHNKIFIRVNDKGERELELLEKD